MPPAARQQYGVSEDVCARSRALSIPLVTRPSTSVGKPLSNWGRWGKDNELGTLNLITPARRKQAAALAKEGFTVSLARDANVTSTERCGMGIPGIWSPNRAGHRGFRS